VPQVHWGGISEWDWGAHVDNRPDLSWVVSGWASSDMDGYAVDAVFLDVMMGGRGTLGSGTEAMRG
jgi:hypothetical protein